MGQWPDGRTPMTKDAQGVWSAEVGPIDAGVWEYSFQVDGLAMIDPGNPAIKPMRQPRTSILHLPGGQSGHPLSPDYRTGHTAWAAGEPLPLLPGPAAHMLRLIPAEP